MGCGGGVVVGRQLWWGEVRGWGGNTLKQPEVMSTSQQTTTPQPTNNGAPLGKVGVTPRVIIMFTQQQGLCGSSGHTWNPEGSGVKCAVVVCVVGWCKWAGVCVGCNMLCVQALLGSVCMLGIRTTGKRQV